MCVRVRVCSTTLNLRISWSANSPNCGRRENVFRGEENVRSGSQILNSLALPHELPLLRESSYFQILKFSRSRVLLILRVFKSRNMFEKEAQGEKSVHGTCGYDLHSDVFMVGKTVRRKRFCRVDRIGRQRHIWDESLLTRHLYRDIVETNTSHHYLYNASIISSQHFSVYL